MKQTLEFLNGLKSYNTVNWVQDNSNQYEDARAEVLELAREVILSLSTFDESLDPDKNPALFLNQILRDTRKSKNKDPYLTYFTLRISPLGNNGNEPIYHIHIEPGASFISIAYWEPDIFGLQVMRNYITKNLNEFENIIENAVFKKLFLLENSKSMQTLPKGYHPGAPAEKYIKLKSYEFSMPISDQELIDKNIVSSIQASFESGYPLIRFFRKGLGLMLI